MAEPIKPQQPKPKPERRPRRGCNCTKKDQGEK